MNASPPPLPRVSGIDVTARDIPDATVARLPQYLRALATVVDSGADTVSSEELASIADVSSAKLRKDLSYLGSYGTRGVGYHCQMLADEIAQALGVSSQWNVVIVGLGRLGQALAGFSGLRARGLQVIALVDADPDVVGTELAGLVISPVQDLAAVICQREISIAVIATPVTAAQEICDALVTAGIRSILNFAPVALQVPEDVVLRHVDLAGELQILVFHEQRRAADQAADALDTLENAR